MIYFTSDEHYSHRNIIDYTHRPFVNEQDMDKALIRNNNQIVTPKDVVFHLGDFTLRSSEHLAWFRKALKSLNGVHHLILGNHDRLNPFQYIDVGFKSVHTSLIVEEFVLVHDPSIAMIDRNRIFLVGHAHDLFKRARNAINMSVENWDYTPVSIDQVRVFIKESV